MSFEVDCIRVPVDVQATDLRARARAVDELHGLVMSKRSEFEAKGIDSSVVLSLQIALKDSNPKVSMQCLSIIRTFLASVNLAGVEQNANSSHHVPSALWHRIFPLVMEKMADSKPHVRENAKELVVDAVLNAPLEVARELGAKLVSLASSHKVAFMREGVISCSSQCHRQLGSDFLPSQSMVQMLCQGLDDTNASVRESALQGLVQMVHLSPAIRQTLQKKQVRPTQLKALDEAVSHLNQQQNKISQGPSRSSASLEDSKSSSGSDENADPQIIGLAGDGLGPGGISELNHSGVLSFGEQFSWTLPDAIHMPSLASALEDVEHVALRLNPQGDWEERVRALRRIAGICLSDVFENVPSTSSSPIVACMNRIKGPLAEAVSDLRSQIVKEAAGCVATLAGHIPRQAFEPIADSISPAAIKLLPASIQIMAESGAVVLRAALGIAKSNKALFHVCHAVTGSKAPVVRAKALHIVILVCKVWSKPDFGKQLQLLSASLLSGLTDASSEARAAARLCTIFLKEIDEQVYSNMRRKVDQSVLKMIDDDVNKDLQVPSTKFSVLSGDVQPPSSAAAICAPSSLSFSKSNAPAKRPLSAAPRATSVLSTSDAPTKKLQARPASASRLPSSDGDGSIRDENGQFAKGSSVGERQPKAGSRLGSAVRVVAEANKNEIEVEMPSKTNRPIRENSWFDPNSNSNHETNKQPAASFSSTGSARGRSGSSSIATRKGQRQDIGQDSAQTQARTFQEADTMTSLLVDLSHANGWSGREQCLSHLIDLTERSCNSRDSCSMPISLAERVLDSAIHFGADSHHRVSLAAVKLCNALLIAIPTAFSTRIDSALYLVLAKASDSRKGSSTLARDACLELLINIIDKQSTELVVGCLTKAACDSKCILRARMMALDKLEMCYSMQPKCQALRSARERLLQLSLIEQSMEVRNASKHTLAVLQGAIPPNQQQVSSSRQPASRQVHSESESKSKSEAHIAAPSTSARVQKVAFGKAQNSHPSSQSSVSSPMEKQASSTTAHKFGHGQRDRNPIHSTESREAQSISSEVTSSQRGPEGKPTHSSISNSANSSATSVVVNRQRSIAHEHTPSKPKNSTGGSPSSHKNGETPSSLPRRATPSSDKVKLAAGARGDVPTSVHRSLDAAVALVAPGAGFDAKSAAEQLREVNQAVVLASKSWSQSGVLGVALASLKVLGTVAEEGLGGTGSPGKSDCCDCAVGLLESLSTHHADVIRKQMDTMLRHSLGALATGGLTRDTATRLTRLLETGISSGARADVCLRTLRELLSQLQPPATQAALHLMRASVSVADKDILVSISPDLSVVLCEAICHSSPEVRKNCVLVWVELYKVLGDSIAPLMRQLQTAQVKLITIYITRALPGTQPKLA